MIETLIFFGAIGLILALWICIWSVGWILVPVGVVMTAITIDVVRDL